MTTTASVPSNGGLDLRSDDEILAELMRFKPVDPANEKNIWAFWDKGLSKCPPWCQRNVISWVRRHGQEWTVRVVDMAEGSGNHFSKYVEPSERFFPAAFLGGTLTGPVAQVCSDLLRLPLLWLHGGVWLDIGFTLFRGLDSLCWDTLESNGNSVEMAGFKISMMQDASMMLNSFIAARKGCVTIKHWYETYLEVWKGAQSTKGMTTHPLLRHLPRYDPPSLDGKKPPFEYNQFSDYLAQVLCLERVRHLKDPSLKWDGPEFFANQVLLFDCGPEVFWCDYLAGWDGRKQYNLLIREKDGAPHDEGYKESEAYVDAILATSSTMKVSHAVTTPGRECLADIWDKPETHDADSLPGTFASYLRWANVHYQAKHALNRVYLGPMEEALLTGPILEVQGSARAD